MAADVVVCKSFYVEYSWSKLLGWSGYLRRSVGNWRYLLLPGSGVWWCYQQLFPSEYVEVVRKDVYSACCSVVVQLVLFTKPVAACHQFRLCILDPIAVQTRDICFEITRLPSYIKKALIVGVCMSERYNGESRRYYRSLTSLNTTYGVKQSLKQVTKKRAKRLNSPHLRYSHGRSLV